MSFSEPRLRLTVFALACVGLAVWEVLQPRRADADRRHRWPVNAALGTMNAVVVRLLAPASGVTFAAWAATRHLGLLPALAFPSVLEGIGAVIALDLLVYLQHRLFHAIPVLWRLHRVHHADRGFDVTTGIRFHPGEIAISTCYKGACIVALGASPAATLVFEMLLSLGSLFSHANVRLAHDRRWRVLLVTPDMHRIHHSTDRREQDTNFGFSVSCWDRLWHTYQEAPARPQDTMPLGLDVGRGDDQ